MFVCLCVCICVSQQTDGEGENLQLLPPDILQLYIQHIAQQAFANGGGEEGEVTAEGEASGDSASGLLHVRELCIVYGCICLYCYECESGVSGEDDWNLEVRLYLSLHFV